MDSDSIKKYDEQMAAIMDQDDEENMWRRTLRMLENSKHTNEILIQVSKTPKILISSATPMINTEYEIDVLLNFLDSPKNK